MNTSWQKIKLKDVADISISNVDKKFHSSEKPVILCNYMDVYTNEYVTSQIDFMEASASYNEIDRFALRKGDVVITKDSETPDDIGVPTIIIEEIPNLVCGYHLALIRPDNKRLNSVFLSKQLSTTQVRQYFSLYASGSTRFGLPVSCIESLEIPLPSVLKQSKIAEILSTVDKAIEQTEALIAKQQRIKTGLMQDLLTRGIDEHGNLRSEETHEFNDSPLGRIPVEWNFSNLGSNCEVCNNLRFPISSQVRETMQGEYPYYGPTGILDYINEYRIDGKYVLIGEDGDHFLKFKNQEMTLLVEGKYNVNNHAHLIKGKGTVLTEWLHFFFLHRDITLFVTRQGAGRLKLNKASLLNLPIIVPIDTEEQKRILHFFKALQNSQKETSEYLIKLKKLKTGLMQDLLTGKVSVTPLLNDSVDE